MVWLAEMFQANLATTQVAATCHRPENLRGRSLIEISLSEFNCSTYSGQGDQNRHIGEIDTDQNTRNSVVDNEIVASDPNTGSQVS